MAKSILFFSFFYNQSKNCVEKMINFSLFPFDCYFLSSCLQTCPSWTAWTPWTECSTTCGRGTRNRIRACLFGMAGQRGCEGDSEGEVSCNAGVRTCEIILHYRCKRTQLRIGYRQRMDRGITSVVLNYIAFCFLVSYVSCTGHLILY